MLTNKVLYIYINLKAYICKMFRQSSVNQSKLISESFIVEQVKRWHCDEIYRWMFQFRQRKIGAHANCFFIWCQCQWFSLDTPLSILVVLSGYSSGSLCVLRCITPSNTDRHDIAVILVEVTLTTHNRTLPSFLSIFLPTLQF